VFVQLVGYFMILNNPTLVCWSIMQFFFMNYSILHLKSFFFCECLFICVYIHFQPLFLVFLLLNRGCHFLVLSFKNHYLNKI
jgi:hypothetical protein